MKPTENFKYNLHISTDTHIKGRDLTQSYDKIPYTTETPTRKAITQRRHKKLR